MTDPGITVVGADALVAAASPEGTRERAFETDATRLDRLALPTGRATPWRASGARGTYAAVLEGRARVEFGPDEDDAAEAGPGEFVLVPPGVVHRLASAGSEPLVVLVVTAGPATDDDADADVDAGGPPADRLPDGPRVAGPDDLVPTGQLKGLLRLTPFPDAPVQQVRGHADGAVESTWHHHGDNDVFGYVLDGQGYVAWGTGPDERALIRTGEFFYVPAGVVHRDVNPVDEPQDYLLWLTGSEPRTVPVHRSDA
jgi:mannose-6-phosphate isomerase-like protein (cupin superfamily)